MPNQVYIEYIGSNALQTFGLVINTGGLLDLQRAVKNWSTAKAYNTKTGSKMFNLKSVCYLSYANRKPEANDNEAGDCYYMKAISGKSA